MWICEKCKEENEDSFETCWKCFKGSDLEKQQLEDANTSEEENKRLKSKNFYSKLGMAFLSYFIVTMGHIILKIPISSFFQQIVISIVLYYILQSIFKKKE